MALVMESDEVILEQPTQKPYKIAIVGPEEKKWGIFEDIKEKAKDLIRISLIQERAIHGNNLVVVSGHCPVGEEHWYCITCKRWLKQEGETFWHPQGHRMVKVYDQGGVDTWVEIIAKELGIKTEIHPAETKGWEDEYLDYGGRNKGYKSRNMDIAEACDILYCIVPSVDVMSVEVYGKKTVALSTDDSKIPYCYHCKTLGHPANGGCWTKKYADSIGKPTHLVLIN